MVPKLSAVPSIEKWMGTIVSPKILEANRTKATCMRTVTTKSICKTIEIFLIPLILLLREDTVAIFKECAL